MFRLKIINVAVHLPHTDSGRSGVGEDHSHRTHMVIFELDSV